MIIDFRQTSNSVEVSCVDDNRDIALISLDLPYGYYKYVECDSADPLKLDNIKSFYNNNIKREPTKYFTKLNINEYFNHDIKVNYPDIYEKINALNLPKCYALDIETEITEEYGYSSPDLAENKILSISFTDEKYDTVIFILKNKTIKETDNIAIHNIIKSTLTEKYENLANFDFKIREFDSETEMLNTFLECVNKYFHCLIGWNVLMYDWVYITNRCKKLGIDIRKASPSKTKTKISFETAYEKKVIELPQHRLILDYMTMFKESLVYGNLESYSLNNISEIILGLNKVQYTGNLKTLYEENYVKFIAYAIIDTILVMLIHNKTKFSDIDFFEGYMNKIPFSKIGQNNISDALLYNKLRDKNIFILESEYSNVEKEKFPGGYVKAPVKKKAKACMGLDFSGLYPNTIISNGISPEKYVDTIQTIDGKVVESDLHKWDRYKKLGFSLTPIGNIYDTREDGIYQEVEKKLIADRKVFKNFANDIYLNIITKIEKEINVRKNK